MNYFDIILIIIIALVSIRGLFRGLITELMTLIALVLGFFIATFYLPEVSGWLNQTIPALPGAASKIISFIFLFLLVNIFVRFLAKMLNQFASFTFLQPVNKLAGGIFAFTKILLVIGILFLLIDLIPHSDLMLNNLGIEQSLLYQPVKKFAQSVYHIIIYMLPNYDSIYQEFIDVFMKADSSAREFINP